MIPLPWSRSRKSGLVLASLAFGLWLAPGAQAAVVLASRGAVQLERAGQAVTMVPELAFEEGDDLNVSADAELVLRLDDGARLAVRPDSRVLFKRLGKGNPIEQRQNLLKIFKGGVRYISGQAPRKSRIAFETPSATIGIRGTDLEIAVTSDSAAAAPRGTYLKVNTGLAVLVALDGTELELAPGQIAFGSEPELTPRGVRALRQPAGRRVEAAPPDVFKAGTLLR